MSAQPPKSREDQIVDEALGRPRFLCPWCAADNPGDFRSIQRAIVEYPIVTAPQEPGGFEYTGEESITFDEGCEHEYFRCLNCQHFFIAQAGNGLNVPIKCHEDADFALLLVASGELSDVFEHGPDGWDTVAARDEEFWESAYASERECWKALRRGAR